MSFGSHYISWSSMCFLSYWCKRRLLISKTWHNNTDNHEKETEKKKNFPLVAHTCSLDPDDDYVNPSNQTVRWKYLFQRNCSGVKKCHILLSLLFLGIPSLLSASPWNTAITAESICEHYRSVTGHPETEGNSLRMQWLCCFVDIMLEFTWGNVRENHNMVLLLRRGGQGTETGSDLIWGFYKPYCGTKKQNSTVHFSLILRNTTVMSALGKRSKMLHQWAKKTCFVKTVEVNVLVPRTKEILKTVT